MDNDPTRGLTDTQAALYDQVINDWSGRDLKQVLADTSASDADKAAVERVLYGNG